jgi:glycosyltransferase involved in cell wall biosynthesis
VTPFYNSADHLGRCIESVLCQSLANFEYILADNCSTDGSDVIARSFAARDPRVRYLRFDALLPQGENYNRALRQISPASRFCKIVQADDYLLQDCLSELTRLAAAHPSAGVVSSLREVDNEIDPSPACAPPECSDGVEICRAMLNGGTYTFGSPTTVMYRADLVRERPDFFRHDAFFDDTDVVLELLRHSDYAFSPRVLSHTSRDPRSTLGRVSSFDIGPLHRYATLCRVGYAYFDPDTLDAMLSSCERDYYERVARAIVRRADRRDYLRFHRAVLWDSAGLTLRPPRLLATLTQHLAGATVRRLHAVVARAATR